MSMKKLAGQTAVYGVSTVLYKALNYLMVFYFTRVMTLAEYGAIGDMYSIIPFAMIILTFGLESGYFRFAGKASTPEAKEGLFATTWGFTSVAAIVFALAAILFCKPLAEVMGYASTPSFVWVVGLIIMFDVMSAIPFAVLRERGRAKRFLVIRTVSVIVNIVFCVLFYTVLPRMAAGGGVFETIYDPNYGAGYAFIANLIASGVTLLMLIFSTGRVAPKINSGQLKTIMVYSLPLLISGIAGTGNEFIDRQMIKYLMPKDVAMSSLGVFTSITRLGAIMLIFTQVYRFGAEPYFLASFKKDDFAKKTAEAMKYFIIVAIGLFLMITLFSDLFALILGRDFREGIYLLPAILVSNILAGVVFNLSFWYKQTEKTRFAIIITGTGLVFTIVFNVLLVPVLGILGAVVARLVCEIVMVGLSYGLNQKYCPIPYDLRRIGEYALLGGVLYGSGIVTGGLPAILKYLCNLVLLGVFGLYALRREKIDLRGLARSVIPKVRNRK